jgi:hypothetical protein
MAAAVFGLFIRKGVPFSLWEELAVLGTIWPYDDGLVPCAGVDLKNKQDRKLYKKELW